MPKKEVIRRKGWKIFFSVRLFCECRWKIIELASNVFFSVSRYFFCWDVEICIHYCCKTSTRVFLLFICSINRKTLRLLIKFLCWKCHYLIIFHSCCIMNNIRNFNGIFEYKILQMQKNICMVLKHLNGFETVEWFSAIFKLRTIQIPNIWFSNEKFKF